MSRVEKRWGKKRAKRMKARRCAHIKRHRHKSKAYLDIPIQEDESRHHRKCRSLNGSDEPSNISVVKITDHRNFHSLFSNYSVHTIAAILNEKWIDPEWKLVVVKR